MSLLSCPFTWNIPGHIIALTTRLLGRYKTQVTGHCFTNTESVLNIHKAKVSFSVLLKQWPVTCVLYLPLGYCTCLLPVSISSCCFTWLYFAEVWICLSLQQMGHVLAPIIKNFYEVMKCVSTNQSGATELVSSMTSFHKLFNLCWSDEFLQTFERYIVRLLSISPMIKEVANLGLYLNPSSKCTLS